MTDPAHLIYPIFLQCTSYCIDKFWINIFNNLAYGITPYGSYIYKDTLTYKTKSDKSFSCIIDTDTEPFALYTNVYDLIHTTMGITSPSQRLDMSNEFETADDRDRTDWATIKKKNVKDMLIDLYALKVMNDHGRSMEDTRHLRGFICTAMAFKAITSTDITMMNGRIDSIKGIDFDDTGVLTHITDIYINDNEDVQSTRGGKRTSMSLNWLKYLEGLDSR